MKEFKRKKLKNGMTVVFEERDLPVVSLCIANKFGAAYEGSDVKGVAHVIEHLMFTGTKKRDHEAISREIEKKGGGINAFTGNDLTNYTFKLPSEHLFVGLEILADMLNNTLFSKDKFEKEKKVIIEELKMYHDIPQRAVGERLVKNMYEEPFGLGIGGSVESVDGLTRDGVKKLFDEVYCPENYVVIIVGECDFEKVCDYLDKKFKKKGNEVKILAVNKKSGRTVEERPGIDQAHYMFGFHTPLIGEKGHDALKVFHAYLAEGMSSRLFLEIREKRGLAYAVHGSVGSEGSHSEYVVYVGTTKEAIKEVEKVIIDEIKKIAENGLSDKDFKEAKEQLIGNYHIGREESSIVMEILLGYEAWGKVEDYYNYEEKIKAVRMDDIKKIAKAALGDWSSAAVVPK